MSRLANFGAIPSHVFETLDDGVRLYIHELESLVAELEKKVSEAKKILEDEKSL